MSASLSKTPRGEAAGGAATLRSEIAPLVRLAAPVALTEVAWMTMGLVDTMMVGRVSAEAIGAVSIGSHVFFAFSMIGGGILLGLDFLIAHAYGAGRMAEAHRALAQGVLLATALAVASTALLWFAAGELHRLGIDAGVLALGVPYLRTTALGLLPVLVFVAIRRYLQAIGLVRPILLIAISSNAINAAANWALIFGHLGAPALGAVGSAWATTISRFYMLLCLLGFVAWHARREDPALLRTSLRPDRAVLRRIARLGLPAASQLTAEVGVFTAATLLAAKLDPVSLAAHQVALGVAALSFMVPLGTSIAASTRVGQAAGRQDRPAMVRSGWTALFLGASFMSLSATVFLLFPHAILRIFTDNEAVVATGVRLLFVAAIFQLFDGLQVVATGVLRGTGDTRTGMIAGLTGYWVLGLPLGYTLCFARGLGVIGLWIGLSAGLIVVAVALVAVWVRRVKHLSAQPTLGELTRRTAPGQHRRRGSWRPWSRRLEPKRETP